MQKRNTDHFKRRDSIEILTDNDLPTLVIVLDVIDCNRQVDDAALGKLPGDLGMGVVILAWWVFH